MKNVLGVIGLIIGAIVGAYVRFDVMHICWGLVIGMFTGFIVAHMMVGKGEVLRERFVKLGTLTGRTAQEIIRAVGPCSKIESCHITDRDDAPGYLYTWQSRAYTIVLLFDVNRVCIGVTKEVSRRY